MRKNNTKKIISLLLVFLITLYISVTYLSLGNFNLFSFSKNTSFLFSQSEAKSIDREYIKSNQYVFVSEPNGVGAISYDYSLQLEDLPSKIVCVSVYFDEQKVSSGSISLKVTDNNTTNSFSISDTNVSGGSTLIKVGNSSVESIQIYSRYDSYGGSKISNEEIVSISSIKINDPADLLTLKKQLVFDIIKGLVITVGLWLVVYIIVKSKADQKIFKSAFCIEKVFLFTAIIAGLIFSFLIPVYQVPDEMTHIKMMYSELNWDIDINSIGDFADTARITRNYDQKVNFSTYFNLSMQSPLPSTFSLPSVQIIRHLPQAIGFVFATLLRLPLWVCVTVAEIFAMLVYAIFGYWAIKILPFKKELMTVIMLLPICLQEFPSFSYDSFLLSAYFLLFAYILYVKFSKEKFTLLDAAIMLSLVFVVAITKIPYVLVAALIITIPISKIDFNFGLFKLSGDFIKKHKILFSLAAGLCVVVAVILGIKILPHISESKIFIAAVSDIKASGKLIFNTIEEYFGEWLIQITGKLGWFDTPVALIFTVFVIANLLFFNLFDFHSKSNKPLEKYPFRIFDVAVIFIAFIGMSFVIILSMFGWTLSAYGIDSDTLSIAQMAEYMSDIPSIGGIQGRYFIPALPLLFVPFYFPKVSKYVHGINHITYLCGYHLNVFMYLVIVLLNRYWI